MSYSSSHNLDHKSNIFKLVSHTIIYLKFFIMVIRKNDLKTYLFFY